MQNVFEVKFAKMPDEPLEQSEADSDSGGKDDAKAIESHSEPSSNSSSDSEDSEEEREKRLEELQAQVCSCVIIHSLQMEAVGVTSQAPSCGYGAQPSQGPVAWWWIIHCLEIITLCVSMLVGFGFHRQCATHSTCDSFKFIRSHKMVKGWWWSQLLFLLSTCIRQSVLLFS